MEATDKQTLNSYGRKGLCKCFILLWKTEDIKLFLNAAKSFWLYGPYLIDTSNQ